MPRRTPLAGLLGAPVHAAGTRVGVVGDVFADPVAEHAIGVEVVGPNGRRWYLPWPAASVVDGRIDAASPLVFVPLDQIDFYVERGVRLEPRTAAGMTVDETGALARADREQAPEGERESTGVA